MSAIVHLESAGDHAFDLGHLRRQGGVELVERLLDDAGLDEDRTWRLQVQKKLMCNGETPPARVVDEPKKWAVYLKIKPGDNDSCHYCSLLMPDGMHGDEVSSALKEVEGTLDRNWKHAPRLRPTPVAVASPQCEEPQSREPAPAEEPPVYSRPPAPFSPRKQEEEPSMPLATNAAEEKSDIRGWTHDPERLRLLLFAIHDVSSTQIPLTDQARFVELLCQKLDWRGLTRYEVGGVLTSLVRQEFVIPVYHGSRRVGYQLSDEGYVQIRDLVEAPIRAATSNGVAEKPADDPVDIILSIGQLAEEFVGARTQLEQIAAREAELIRELETLRKKKTEVCKILENKDVQKMMARLMQMKM